MSLRRPLPVSPGAAWVSRRSAPASRTCQVVPPCLTCPSFSPRTIPDIRSPHQDARAGSTFFKETTMTTTTNGRERKSLANEIDRLDTILDGLAEALNESVAAAVRASVSQIVRETVEASVKEVL